jgi:hypothetical protein
MLRMSLYVTYYIPLCFYSEVSVRVIRIGTKIVSRTNIDCSWPENGLACLKNSHILQLEFRTMSRCNLLEKFPWALVQPRETGSLR